MSGNKGKREIVNLDAIEKYLEYSEEFLNTHIRLKETLENLKTTLQNNMENSTQDSIKSKDQSPDQPEAKPFKPKR